jgi:hypothetical protein
MVSMLDNARAEPAGYRIVVRGEIGPNIVAHLEGVSAEVVGHQTVLELEPVDQEQLRETLDWLSDAGIEIVSLTQLAP